MKTHKKSFNRKGRKGKQTTKQTTSTLSLTRFLVADESANSGKNFSIFLGVLCGSAFILETAVEPPIDSSQYPLEGYADGMETMAATSERRKIKAVQWFISITHKVNVSALGRH